MARHVTVTLAVDFAFESEEWGIDFESMSDDDLRDFAITEFWEVVPEVSEYAVDVDIHDNV